MSRATTRSVLVILAVALATYLIGNERVSLWDRDEPRYAQTSRQMLQSGDWVVPRFLDTVRTAKPPLIYWCQAASMKVFGDNAAAARLPSALAMTATLVLLATMLRSRRGMWSVFIVASSVMAIWAAKSALTDAVLLFFVTIAQLCLYAIWRGRFSWGVAILFGTAVALAGLTKGPVVLGFIGTTMVALWMLGLKQKAAARASRYTGIKVAVVIAFVAVIVTPWVLMVEHRHPGFISQAFNREVVDRARNAQEGHSGWPGYYVLTIWGMFFPWSLLLPATAVTAWTNRRLPHIRFAMAAVIGPWIMLELVTTKLPHYLLPAYPFLAFLTADMLVRAGRGAIKDLVNPPFVRITMGWAALVGVLGLLPWIVLRWFPISTWTGITMAVMSILAAEWGRNVYVSFRGKKPLIAAGIMGAGMMVIVIILHVGVLPNMDFLRLSRRAADTLLAHDATMPGEEIMIDYKEPSLAFYQGGTIREEWRSDYLDKVDPIFWPMWIVTTGEVWHAVSPRAKQRLELIQTLHGYDYAGRGRVNVVVLRKREAVFSKSEVRNPKSEANPKSQ